MGILIIHGHHKVWASAKAPTLGDQSLAHRVGAQGLPPWVAGEGCISVVGGSPLRMLRAPSGHGEQQARGRRYQSPQALQGPACFIKTKGRVSLKILFFPQISLLAASVATHVSDESTFK